MAKVKQRRQRILDLLPRIYATQPEHTAIGAIIDMMANTLARLDADTERVMRDHWVNFASGANESDVGDSSALENLGHLLSIPQLPSEHNEAYRRRLMLTSEIFSKGLTSPDALLRLVIVSLGAEPCKHVKREKDATIISGVPLGLRRQCSVCQGKQNDECPNRELQVVEASLIENPLVAEKLTLEFEKSDEDFTVSNPSMVEDVAVITFKTRDKKVPFPGLRNKGTNEIIFYAGDLQAGEKLNIFPPVTEQELAPFVSYEEVGHHDWAKRNPEGMALLTEVDGTVRNVSADIFFYTGYTFDNTTFALPDANEPRFTALRFSDDLFADKAPDTGPSFDEAKFSSVQSMFDTPRIRTGKDDWVYRTYTYDDIFKVAGEEAAEILAKAPKNPAKASIEVTLEWWSRPPSTFRMRIPKTLWVHSAEARGALELVFSNVERARAAGVQAILDFPEPVNTEAHPITDQFAIALKHSWPEQHVLGDTEPESELHKSPVEQQQLGEETLLWNGLFDKTTLDNSYFE